MVCLCHSLLLLRGHGPAPPKFALLVITSLKSQFGRDPNPSPNQLPVLPAQDHCKRALMAIGLPRGTMFISPSQPVGVAVVANETGHVCMQHASHLLLALGAACDGLVKGFIPQIVGVRGTAVECGGDVPMVQVDRRCVGERRRQMGRLPNGRDESVLAIGRFGAHVLWPNTDSLVPIRGMSRRGVWIESIQLSDILAGQARKESAHEPRKLVRIGELPIHVQRSFIAAESGHQWYLVVLASAPAFERWSRNHVAVNHRPEGPLH